MNINCALDGLSFGQHTEPRQHYCGEVWPCYSAMALAGSHIDWSISGLLSWISRWTRRPRSLRTSNQKLSVLNLSIQWEEGKKRQVRVEKEGPVLPWDRRRERGGDVCVSHCWEHGQLERSPMPLCSMTAWWVAPQATSWGIGAWMGLRPRAGGTRNPLHPAPESFKGAGVIELYWTKTDTLALFLSFRFKTMDSDSHTHWLVALQVDFHLTGCQSAV